ncbi:hypothetical protein CQ017_04160 [Arthrobacter sp. MYb224]|nr:hypothetical protein CQ017_04160 [Arthrobacter sp. MYb224]
MRRTERGKNAPAINAGWWRRPLALGTVSSLAITSFGLPAMADINTSPDDATESAASIIDLSLLGQELAGGGQTRALFPSGPATDEGALNASLLGGEMLDLGGLQLPIDQIIDYGELGALLSRSTATDAKNGEAITGIAGADGSVTLDGQAADFGNAKLDLLSLFRETGVDGLTDEILSKAELTAGVGGAWVQAVDGEFQDPDGVGGAGQYRVAEANLELQSPVVETVAGTLYEQIGQIDQLMEETVGGLGDLTSMITSITDALPAGATLDYTIESNMQDEIFDEILAQPITSKNEILTIDFSTGQVYIDLDKAYSGERPEGVDLPDGINNQNPNTELISNEIYPIIAESVHDLMEEVVAIAVSAIEGALGSVTLNLEAGVSALGNTATANWSVNLMGDAQPVVCESEGLGGAALCATLETAINTVVGPIVQTALVPIRDYILSDGGKAIFETLLTDLKTGAITLPIRQLLEPVFTLLSQVISVQLNRQDVTTAEGPDGEVTESLEVSALSLGLLQAADAGRLNFGTAGVRIDAAENAITPALTVDPTAIDPGQSTNVTGTGFTPAGDVQIQLTDAEGNPVGEAITVPADEAGNLPETALPVPADATPGEYNVVATDVTTGTPVQGPLTVNDPGQTPEPGNGIIGDTVFADANANGIQDAGEAGVPNVTVNLLDASGTAVPNEDGTPRSTTSDDQGKYSFGELPAGEYIVEFVAPEGSVFAPANQGDDDAVDSDAAENGRTEVVALTAEAPTTDTVDAGLVADDAENPDTPSITVDPTEVPAGDETTVTGEGFQPDSTVTIQLEDAEGNPVGDPIEAPVDAEGNFTNALPVPEDAAPGDYQVVVTDADGNETTNPITVTDADGAGNNGELGDRVWRDLDADGIQDAGEAGLAGVSVNLLDAAGTPVTDANGAPVTATTDGNGNYTFTGLELGEYSVEFVAPEGASFSPAAAGDDRELDSDAGENGRSAVIALTSVAPVNLSVDAGVVDAPAVEDATVTVDPTEVAPGEETQVTGDGFAPDSETTVQLTDGEGNPVGDPITVTTDENSHFTTPLAVPEDAAPGEYQIVVTDSEGNTDSTQLTVGEPDDGGETPNPDANGELGDRVWRDLDADGIQDSGEAGLAGVSVKLLDASGNPVTDTNGAEITATTDENGLYRFTGLALGEYTVEFAAPQDASFSPAGVGEDRGLDSDAGENGRTAVLTLTSAAPVDLGVDAGVVDAPAVEDATVTVDPAEVAPGEETQVTGDGFAPDSETTVQLTDGEGNPVGDPITVTTDENGHFTTPVAVPEDAAPGEYQIVVTDSEGNTDSTNLVVANPDEGNGSNPGQLGDRVWRDANGNGLQDEGEAGLSGVTVKLLDAEGNPVNDISGNPKTTTTDENGTYRFAGLTIRQYIVEFDAPEGASFAPAREGSDRAIDSDAGENGRTEVVALTNVAPINNGVDAGVVDAPAAEEATVTVDPAEVQPGEETQVTGEGYAPNSEIRVVLTDAEGNPVGDPIISTTDDNGHFSVALMVPADRAPGQYQVQATDAEGNEDSTTLVVVEGNGNGDGSGNGSIGDFVWFDENADGLQSEGERGQGDVRVNLLDAEGNAVLSTEGNPITTVTGEDGMYSFAGLNQGQYTVEFVAPQGGTFSPSAAGDNRAVDSDAGENGRSAVVTLSQSAPTTTEVDAGITFQDGDSELNPEFTVNPDNAGPGDTITIDGEGYAPNTPIVIELRDKDGNVTHEIEVESDENGEIHTELVIPEDIEDGEYQIVTVDPDGNEESRSITIRDTPTDTCATETALSINPTQVNPGENITINGTGYTEGETITVEITGVDGKTIELSLAEASAKGMVVIDESCAFELKVQIPEDAEEGTYTVNTKDENGKVLDSGEFQVVGNDGSGNDSDNEGSDQNGSNDSKDKDGLANTGAEVVWYSLLGLLAAAGGVVLTMAARRRGRQS